MSGPMIPGSQALLISIFPPNKRGTALGIWSITTLVAPICGPILGGYISDNYHWGWIFLINVPVGLLVTLPVLAQPARPRDADPQAADRHASAWACWWSGSARCRSCWTPARMPDWFASTQIVILAIITAIGFVAFLIWELTEKHPDRRSVAVQEPQLRAGHAGLLSGLCRVLRQQPAAAAVAADPDRLHRDLGRAGGGAHRRRSRCC